PSQPLFSLHVPKTAGTSFRKDLEGWFGPDLALHYRGDQGEPPARAALRPGLCVHGHFNRLRGIGVRQYYPDAGQFIVLRPAPFARLSPPGPFPLSKLRGGGGVPVSADRPPLAPWLARRRRRGDARKVPFSFLPPPADPTNPADPAAVFG